MIIRYLKSIVRTKFGDLFVIFFLIIYKIIRKSTLLTYFYLSINSNYLSLFLYIFFSLCAPLYLFLYFHTLILVGMFVYNYLIMYIRYIVFESLKCIRSPFPHTGLECIPLGMYSLLFLTPYTQHNLTKYFSYRYIYTYVLCVVPTIHNP